MKKTRVTNADLLKKIEALEREVAELKKVAHPQHVMADPELTEAIKQLTERFAPPQSPSYPTTDTLPGWLQRTTYCKAGQNGLIC